MLTKALKQAMLQGMAGDSFKVALYNSSASLDENTTVYSPTNEITATGYTAGGCTLSGANVAVDGSGYALNFDAYTFTDCNIVCRKAAIYNTSKGNMVVSVIDYGSDVGVVGSGTFVVDVVVRLP